MPLVVYSVLRLALFGVCLGLLWWAGLRSWLVAIVAALLAWALSYVLLNGPRDAAARQLAERAERRRDAGDRPVLSRRAQEDADVEDAAVDAGLEGEPEAEQHAERELEEPGAGEHGDQRAPAGAEQHGDRQHDRGRQQQEHEQRPD